MATRAYHTEIEERVIFPNFNSDYTAVGNMVIFRINDAHGNKIGMEANVRRRHQSEINPDLFILRAFFDGTALYQPGRIHNISRNYRVYRNIDSMVRQNYTFPSQRFNGIYQGIRKPINHSAGALVRTALAQRNNSGSFSDRLLSIKEREA